MAYLEGCASLHPAIRHRRCSACILPNSRILASVDDQLTAGAALTAGSKCRRRRRADLPELAAVARPIWRRRRRGVTGLGLYLEVTVTKHWCLEHEFVVLQHLEQCMQTSEQPAALCWAERNYFRTAKM